MNNPRPNLLSVAVVGHTNTGKTSLMRTLMRDVQFGEVSDRPAVTREVQGAVLTFDGRPALQLFDTPGLEDSISLLEHLEQRRGARRVDGIDVIREFLDADEARGRFQQEAKALRQVISSDVALYVIDVRDRVLAKHRDELEILSCCARPVVPVLNFTADANAKTAVWREHLSRVNMHAVAEFDTVVFDEEDERRLFEKMATLLDAHRPTLEGIVRERTRQRSDLLRASLIAVAELLVDAASLAVRVPAKEGGQQQQGVETLKDKVRRREQKCVEQLLNLFRFRPGDVTGESLPIAGGQWGVDLFSREAMKQFGVRAGGGAAAGAMVGLTIDAMLGGASLGAGAAAGAAVGGLLGTLTTHGRRMLDRARGFSEVRCDDATLTLLAARQLALIAALLSRGHAAMHAVRLDAPSQSSALKRLPGEAKELVDRARLHPQWSTLADPPSPARLSDPPRQETIDELAHALGRVRERVSG